MCQVKFSVSEKPVCSSLCFLVVFVEPSSLRNQLQSDRGAVPGKSQSSVSDDGRGDELKAVSSSDKTEARVSSSAHDNRC